MSAAGYRIRVSLGPHAEVSRRTVLMPAKEGVGEHVSTLVVTSCGREVSATLVTRSADRVRCPDCMERQS